MSREWTEAIEAEIARKKAKFLGSKHAQYLSMPDRVPNGEPLNDAIAAMQARQKEERK